MTVAAESVGVAHEYRGTVLFAFAAEDLGPANTRLSINIMQLNSTTQQTAIVSLDWIVTNLDFIRLLECADVVKLAVCCGVAVFAVEHIEAHAISRIANE